jgi:hypothetical protein
MSGSGFTWVAGKTPEHLGDAIADYAEKAKVALHAIAGKWGQDVQDDARQKGPWEDRTGNARSGIFYAVDGLGFGTLIGEVSAASQALMKDTSVEQGNNDILIIVVSHTVFYGKFLETKNGGRYAIIMSTIEKNLPRLERLAQRIFKR